MQLRSIDENESNVFLVYQKIPFLVEYADDTSGFFFTQPLQSLMETRPSVGSEPSLTPSPDRCIRSCPHRTVTLGSWVTPQVITALVPLITLWS